MTDKKYTNEDIISSLKIIATTRNCNECKIRNCKWGTCNCEQITANAALDLFNRLQAENERLQKEVNLVSIQFQDLQERTDEIKAKAYKEFVEKLKKKCYEDFEESDEMLAPYVTEDNIDEVLKEMVGDSNDTANKGDRL